MPNRVREDEIESPGTLRCGRARAKQFLAWLGSVCACLALGAPTWPQASAREPRADIAPTGSPEARSSLWESAGNDSIPALFRIAAGSALAGDWSASPNGPAGAAPSQARKALRRMPMRPVLDHIRSQLAASPTLGARAAALDILGAFSADASLELWLDQARALPAVQRSNDMFRLLLRRSLLEVVQRNPRAWSRLASPATLASLDGEALELVLDTVELHGRPDALEALLGLIGRDSVLDRRLATLVAEIELRFPWRSDRRAREALRAHIRDLARNAEPAARMAALASVARLRDPDLLQLAIRLLGDTSPEVRERARTTLACALLLLPEPPSDEPIRASTEQARWRAALARETNWWSEHERELRAHLRSGSETRIAAAVTEVQLHPLFRHELASEIALALSDCGGALTIELCRTLALLGSAEPVPPLAELLHDPDPRVRRAACESLRALTGVDLPPEPRIWERYVNG